MILHVDMDAFYASVEERERPELANQPVIVGGDASGRGVVCAANYRARKFGVHSAMPTAQAIRLCPDAVVLPPRMEFYAAASAKIRDIFHRYTPVVEPLSLDEAFLDATGSVQLFGSVETIGRSIKNDIRNEVQLVASVGVAPNKFLAKLASDLDKPDGFTVIQPDKIRETLDPLPVSRIWGVGRVTGRRMESLGVRTIGHLRELSREALKNAFGKSGDHFWRLARGIDDREVIPDREAKSISHETTFAKDITDIDMLHAWLLELTEQVAGRMRRQDIKGKTVQLKIRYEDFSTITRSRSLDAPTNSTQKLWKVTQDLFDNQRPDRRLCVRLLGMGVSGLQHPSAKQLDLFADSEPEDDRDSRIDSVSDLIRQRFGSSKLKRASTVQHNIEHRAQPRPDAPPPTGNTDS